MSYPYACSSVQPSAQGHSSPRALDCLTRQPGVCFIGIGMTRTKFRTIWGHRVATALWHRPWRAQASSLKPGTRQGMSEKLRPAAGWAKFNEHPPGVCVLHVIFTLRVGLYMIRTHAFPPYDALEPRRLAREQGTAGRLDWPAANLATHPARGQPTTQAATQGGSPKDH